MFTHALIAVTILSAGAPGALVSNTPVESGTACSVLLDATAQGIDAAYKANAMSVHRLTSTVIEDSWTVIRTGMGRDIARLKCVNLNSKG